jgi:hypothetical protein
VTVGRRLHVIALGPYMAFAALVLAAFALGAAVPVVCLARLRSVGRLWAALERRLSV